MTKSIARLKEVAKAFELMSIIFFDKEGNYSQKIDEDVYRVELLFANGETFSVAYQVFNRDLANFSFKFAEDYKTTQ
jgi:hypothetical protein